MKVQNYCINKHSELIFEYKTKNKWCTLPLNESPLVSIVQRFCCLGIYIWYYSYRLSSIDMKYHIWKLGVVFTDNVRETPFFSLLISTL